MDIKFYCPHCDQKLVCEDSAAGQNIECPQCASSIAVPNAAAAEEVTPQEPLVSEPQVVDSSNQPQKRPKTNPSRKKTMRGSNPTKARSSTRRKTRVQQKSGNGLLVTAFLFIVFTGAAIFFFKDKFQSAMVDDQKIAKNNAPKVGEPLEASEEASASENNELDKSSFEEDDYSEPAVIESTAPYVKPEPVGPPEIKGVDEKVQPFLTQYCLDCHNNSKDKGELNLEELNGFHTNADTLEMWHDIYDQIKEGEMPPEEENQPSEQERKSMMAWIQKQMVAGKEDMKKATYTHLRRLNNNEYNRTVGDLLKIDTSLLDLSRNFPTDELKENFKNNGEALQVSSFHLEAYIEAAEEAINKAVYFGDKPEIQTNTFRPPYSKSNNVLKAARVLGKDKFMDLVEQRSYAFHPEQLSGVPESGYYKVTAKVQARNRKHDLNPKSFKVPQDQLLRASIVLTDPRTGDSNYFTASDRTAQEFELKDEKVMEVSGKYWIDKGYTAKIGFPNSIPFFKPAKGKFDRKKFKKFYKGRTGPFGGFLAAQDVMRDHGPVVRVFEYKIEGPFYDEWPIASHKNLFAKKTLNEININTAIDSFASRAFRRSIKSEDTAAIKAMMKRLLSSGFTKEESIKAGLVAVLSSPQFFYLQENEGTLNDYALANRLSYFLWSSMPDKELMAYAKAGRLRHPSILEKQVIRMMKSPKIEGFINNFSDGWLQLNKLGTMPPDRKQNVDYYVNDLEHAGRQETLHFVKDLLYSNGKIRNFLNSDYTFMNRGLATFYGRKDVSSFKYNAYKKVKLSDPRRGGLLGQMSLLTATADGIDTTPVVRGAWVVENIFGEHLKEPPGVPAIEPDIRGAKTIRQLLVQHTTDKNCASCHDKIDPPGFALENFDHVGRWRDNYNENRKKMQVMPVDASGRMARGQRFDDIVDFKKILISKQDVFTQALTTKLLTYALGREVRSFEKAKVASIGRRKENFRDLVMAVVKSDLFRRK
ncbi:hypothetical protein LNTAR_11296 [Lentisphaera araneosa HTCC2155]|uniref:Cytochrome c domain-containing protein n=1 Tax=Lentisphaera araneosa HTCC2155 TaxID=313628 RepID=A6DJ62_9BACT|nr:DUF1592 domain-containing protein [Lentisphaera araneosa]EDM28498.1 hypothetical protein LNTAR_11296 [Lentisphaera araneosa HTCC2155]